MDKEYNYKRWKNIIEDLLTHHQLNSKTEDEKNYFNNKQFFKDGGFTLTNGYDIFVGKGDKEVDKIFNENK